MITSILKAQPEFADFSDEELFLLVNLCQQVSVKKGQAVVRESQQDDGALYFIQEGIVKISKAAGAKQEIIAMFGMGNIFGEMSFLDSRPRSALAVADENTVLFKFLPEKMRELENHAPKTAIKLFRVFVSKLVTRLRQTDDALVEKGKHIIVT